MRRDLLGERICIIAPVTIVHLGPKCQVNIFWRKEWEREGGRKEEGRREGKEDERQAEEEKRWPFLLLFLSSTICQQTMGMATTHPVLVRPLQTRQGLQFELSRKKTLPERECGSFYWEVTPVRGKGREKEWLDLTKPPSAPQGALE